MFVLDCNEEGSEVRVVVDLEAGSELDNWQSLPSEYSNISLFYLLTEQFFIALLGYFKQPLCEQLFIINLTNIRSL